MFVGMYKLFKKKKTYLTIKYYVVVNTVTSVIHFFPILYTIFPFYVFKF